MAVRTLNRVCHGDRQWVRNFVFMPNVHHVAVCCGSGRNQAGLWEIYPDVSVHVFAPYNPNPERIVKFSDTFSTISLCLSLKIVSFLG